MKRVYYYVKDGQLLGDGTREMADDLATKDALESEDLSNELLDGLIATAIRSFQKQHKTKVKAIDASWYMYISGCMVGMLYYEKMSSSQGCFYSDMVDELLERNAEC